ncbi:MAG: YraN family protein [Lachnospiraceae bacterium]|nr:YraN family protein [Lachnospiraceae bacterium]
MIGTCAEERAAVFLQARGMQILARNYRCRQGEIDLIARDGRYLVFVEVKYRSSACCADPLSAVNRAKQRKICRVADYFRFTQKVPDDVPVRYDVIGILGEKTAWIPDAFPHQPGT